MRSKEGGVFFHSKSHRGDKSRNIPGLVGEAHLCLQGLMGNAVLCGPALKPADAGTPAISPGSPLPPAEVLAWFGPSRPGVG